MNLDNYLSLELYNVINSNKRRKIERNGESKIRTHGRWSKEESDTEKKEIEMARFIKKKV